MKQVGPLQPPAHTDMGAKQRQDQGTGREAVDKRLFTSLFTACMVHGG